MAFADLQGCRIAYSAGTGTTRGIRAASAAFILFRNYSVITGAFSRAVELSGWSTLQMAGTMNWIKSATLGISNASGYIDALNQLTLTSVTTSFQGFRHQQYKGDDSASGSTLTLSTTGSYFHITGTTTINYITTSSWIPGQIVVLKFNSSLTVTHNAASVPANTAAILLSGAANFSATADDTLQLVYDGSNWREVSRTVI